MTDAASRQESSQQNCSHSGCSHSTHSTSSDPYSYPSSQLTGNHKHNRPTNEGTRRKLRTKRARVATTFGALVTAAASLLFVVSAFGVWHLHRSLSVAHPSFDFKSGNHHHHRSHNDPIRDALAQSSTTHTVTYPVEKPLPNPPLPNGNDTFSSCLLVMDDNHRLVEWLAYHYHVLPLRYIVVAVDPRSKTSPTHIFNVWRRQGVVIEEWNDSDFWKQDHLRLTPIPETADLQVKRDRHRGRQKFFYKKCLMHLKRRNRTWVALHDSDEYLLYNHAGGERFDAYMKHLRHRVEARHKLELETNNRNPSVSLQVLVPAQIPPTTADEGAMIRYIRHEQQAGLDYYQSPCIGVPRLMFGAEEDGPDIHALDRVAPSELVSHARQLDTLRYRKHARRNDFVKNALGKVLIDVSRVDIANVPNFMSLHRPIKTLCSAPWHNDWESGLRINHYLGSWESYSFRDDSRKGYERSKEQWEYKATTNGEQTDDHIRPWLSGFAQTHGIDKAKQLLQGAGLPPNYRNKNNHQWHLLPEKYVAFA